MQVGSLSLGACYVYDTHTLEKKALTVLKVCVHALAHAVRLSADQGSVLDSLSLLPSLDARCLGRTICDHHTCKVSVRYWQSLHGMTPLVSAYLTLSTQTCWSGCLFSRMSQASGQPTYLAYKCSHLSAALVIAAQLGRAADRLCNAPMGNLLLAAAQQPCCFEKV